MSNRTPCPLLSGLYSSILILALSFVVGMQPAISGEKTPEMVVFGDSTSDTGNAYAILGVLAEAPFEPIPPAPYAISEGRFSNGKVWIEQLAKSLRIRKGAKAFLFNEKRNTNFATARARARFITNPIDPINSIGLSSQVGTFLQTVDNEAPPEALYVLWIGGNDIRDALATAIATNNLPLALNVVNEAVESIAANIIELHYHDARRFLVLNAPNIALLPLVSMQELPVVSAAAMLSGSFNDTLAFALDELESLPDSSITLFDTNELISDVIQNPADYAITNTSAPCLSFRTLIDPICSRPDEYVFWDSIHPTRKIHSILAERVETELFLDDMIETWMKVNKRK